MDSNKMSCPWWHSKKLEDERQGSRPEIVVPLDLDPMHFCCFFKSSQLTFWAWADHRNCDLSVSSWRCPATRLTQVKSEENGHFTQSRRPKVTKIEEMPNGEGKKKHLFIVSLIGTTLVPYKGGTGWD